MTPEISQTPGEFSMAKPAEFDPLKHFALQDISLWSTALKRDAEYQPIDHENKLQLQTMQSTKPELLTATGMDDEQFPLLRTLVTFGLRSVCKDGDGEEAVIYTVEAVFAVEYVVLEPPSADQLKQFVDFNCVHNAWPFWRQHVYDTLKRASLPVPAVPLFAGRSPKKPRKQLKRVTRVPRVSQDKVVIDSE